MMMIIVVIMITMTKTMNVNDNRNTMGAIHSTKISGNFGPKLNGSVRSNRKSFEKTGPPFEVVLFSRSDRLEFWLNGSRPIAIRPMTTTFLATISEGIEIFYALCNLTKFARYLTHILCFFSFNCIIFDHD